MNGARDNESHNSRPSSPQATRTQVEKWRKRQVQMVAFSVAAFVGSLAGGAIRSPILAQTGAVLFVVCVVLIIVFGVFAHLGRKRNSRTEAQGRRDGAAKSRP